MRFLSSEWLATRQHGGSFIIFTHIKCEGKNICQINHIKYEYDIVPFDGSI